MRQAYATADLGVIAYETDDAQGARRDGMVVNDGVIVEIVRARLGRSRARGERRRGRRDRVAPDFPCCVSPPAISPRFSERERRIKGWLGRADQTTKVKGLFVHPGQVVEIGKRHPELGTLRLVVGREGEQDAMTLRAERRAADGPAERSRATMQATPSCAAPWNSSRRARCPTTAR